MSVWICFGSGEGKERRGGRKKVEDGPEELKGVGSSLGGMWPQKKGAHPAQAPSGREIGVEARGLGTGRVRVG